MEDVADVFGLDEHLERVLVLVDDDVVGVTFLHIRLEVGVRGILAGACRFGQGVAAAREEQECQGHGNEDV